MMMYTKRVLAGAALGAAALAPLALQQSAAATDCVTQAAATQAAASSFDSAMGTYLQLLGKSQDAGGRLHRARVHHRSASTIARLRREAVAVRRATREARQVAYQYGVRLRTEESRDAQCQTGATGASGSSATSSSAPLDQLLALLSSSGANMAGAGTTATEGLPIPSSTQAQENQLVELLNQALQGKAAAAGIPGPTDIVPLLLGIG